jgi:hypothetical protein
MCGLFIKVFCTKVFHFSSKNNPSSASLSNFCLSLKAPEIDSLIAEMIRLPIKYVNDNSMTRSMTGELNIAVGVRGFI